MDVCVQSGEHNTTWWQRTCGVRWHPSVGDWRIVEFFNSAGGARLGLVSIRWNGNKSTITSFPMKTPGTAFVVKVTPGTSNVKPNPSFCGAAQGDLVYFLLCPGGHCICFRDSKHFDCCSVTVKQTEGLLVMSTGSSIEIGWMYSMKKNHHRYASRSPTQKVTSYKSHHGYLSQISKPDGWITLGLPACVHLQLHRNVASTRKMIHQTEWNNLEFHATF